MQTQHAHNTLGDKPRNERAPTARSFARELAIAVAAGAFTLFLQVIGNETPTDKFALVCWIMSLASLGVAISGATTLFLMNLTSVELRRVFTGEIERDEFDTTKIFFGVFSGTVFALFLAILFYLLKAHWIAGACFIVGSAACLKVYKVFREAAFCEAASGRYEPDAQQTSLPLVLITACRPAPGGEVNREWIQITNFASYSIPLDNCRLLLGNRLDFNVLWCGSNGSLLLKRASFRIHSGSQTNLRKSETKGRKISQRSWLNKSEFILDKPSNAFPQEPRELNFVELRLEYLVEGKYQRLDSVQWRKSCPAGKILRRGNILFGWTNHFKNEYS